MAAFTLPYDLMMDILWLAATAVGSKMNDVGWISGSSVARTCLMVGRNHGGEGGEGLVDMMEDVGLVVVAEEED